MAAEAGPLLAGELYRCEAAGPEPLVGGLPAARLTRPGGGWVTLAGADVGPFEPGREYRLTALESALPAAAGGGAPPRDPEALRGYLLGRLGDALARPRLLGPDGVQMARGFRAFLPLLGKDVLQVLSDCFAAVAGGAEGRDVTGGRKCPRCGGEMDRGRVDVGQDERVRYVNYYCPKCDLHERVREED